MSIVLAATTRSQLPSGPVRPFQAFWKKDTVAIPEHCDEQLYFIIGLQHRFSLRSHRSPLYYAKNAVSEERIQNSFGHYFEITPPVSPGSYSCLYPLPAYCKLDDRLIGYRINGSIGLFSG